MPSPGWRIVPRPDRTCFHWPQGSATKEVKIRVLRQITRPLGEAVQYALDSWNRTARLCCILVASGVAAGLYALLKGA